MVMVNLICYLQRKEPVGDSEELPKNVLNGLEELSPEMLQVKLFFPFYTTVFSTFDHLTNDNIITSQLL